MTEARAGQGAQPTDRLRAAPPPTGITLPYAPRDIHHRWGAKILEVVGITHELGKPRAGRSTDTWCFIVRWQSPDGTPSDTVHSVYPEQLCSETPEGRGELADLAKTMTDYLASHGEWRKDNPRGWYAHRPAKGAPRNEA